MQFTRHVIGFRTDIDARNTSLGLQIDVQNSDIGFDPIGDDSDGVGIYLSAEYDPLDNLSLFCRGDFRYFWMVQQDNREFLDYPRYVVALGGRLSLPFGLRLNLAARVVGAIETRIRNPYSILLPSVPVSMPAKLNVLANIDYRFDFAGGKLDVGLNAFDPLNARFREQAGVIKTDGRNYGGEILGRRIMLTASFDY